MNATALNNTVGIDEIMKELCIVILILYIIKIDSRTLWPKYLLLSVFEVVLASCR